MKKKVYFDSKIEKQLLDLHKDVQKQLYAHIEALANEGFLEFPYARKLSFELFEIRILQPENWRFIYSYLEGDKIIILFGFHKKSNKTPGKALAIALSKLRKYQK